MARKSGLFRRWILPLASLASLVHAQQPVPEGVLAPVTISATRTEKAPFDVPASIDVIDGERLRADGRAQLNLSEAIGVLPGVLARDRQNQAQDLQLSVRGFGARSTFGVRGVRLYVDGIPATMPDGQGQLSHIDLASAERVEVLRGPFSALYGNSSGGVVQVFTAPGEGRPELTVSTALGRDDFLRAGVKVSGSTPGLAYSLSGSRFDLGGYREHSAARRSLVNARLDGTLAGGGQWTLVANSLGVAADDPLGLTRARFDAMPQSADPVALQFNTRKSVQQNQLGLVYSHPLGAGQTLRAMVYQGERATLQYQAIPVAAQASPVHPGGVIDLGRRYGGIDLSWTGRTQLMGQPLEAVAGLAYDTLREHRQGRLNFDAGRLGVDGALRRDEINRVRSLDPYVQASWQLSPQWAINAGVRRSRVQFQSDDQYVVGANGNDSGQVRFAATLPVAGVSYAPSSDLRWYAATGRGFETPTLNELAYRASGTGGLNFALRPSRSRSMEAGVKGRSPAGSPVSADWSVALFQTRTLDEIVTQTNVGGRSTFQNAGTTRRRGLEAAYGLRLPGHWHLQAAYSWLDARYQDGFASCQATPCALPNVLVPAGKRIPGLPRSSLVLEVGWRPPTGWRAGADTRMLGSVPVNDTNTEAAQGFAVLAAHLGYGVDAGPWRISSSLRIDNLLGKRYAGSVIVNEGNGRYFEPGAGRTAQISLTGSYRF